MPFNNCQIYIIINSICILCNNNGIGGVEMVKKRVSVQIEGRSYVLVTTDDEKYVESVAEEITKRIRKAAQSSKHLDTRDCAVLAALDLCDDRNKAQKKNKDIVGKADKIIQNTNELSKSCKEYKERLAEAINENTSLTRRTRVLEEQLRAVSKENEQLKNQLEKCGKLKEFEKALQEEKTDKSKNSAELKQYSLFDKDDKKKNAKN